MISLYCYVEKKSMNKFLTFFNVSLKSKWSPWNTKTGFVWNSKLFTYPKAWWSEAPNSTISITFELNILPIMISWGLFFWEFPNTKKADSNLEQMCSIFEASSNGYTSYFLWPKLIVRSGSHIDLRLYMISFVA